MEQTMEQKGVWNDFLNKSVKAIIDDPGSQYPRKKEGVLISETPTHLMIKTGPEHTDAILLTKILRLEINEHE